MALLEVRDIDSIEKYNSYNVGYFLNLENGTEGNCFHRNSYPSRIFRFLYIIVRILYYSLILEMCILAKCIGKSVSKF